MQVNSCKKTTYEQFFIAFLLTLANFYQFFLQNFWTFSGFFWVFLGFSGFFKLFLGFSGFFKLFLAFSGLFLAFSGFFCLFLAELNNIVPITDFTANGCTGLKLIFWKFADNLRKHESSHVINIR
jgi:hypothetical protein